MTGFNDIRKEIMQKRAALVAHYETTIDQRRAAHQAAVGAAKQQAPPGAARPLSLLAIGDSWFDYPVTNLQLPAPILVDNSIIGADNLRAQIAPPPHILSLAEHGQCMTDILGLPKLKMMIADLGNPANWFTGKPDAILISGGGNDVVGDRFTIFVDPRAKQLDTAAFDGMLDFVSAAYQKLFRLRDLYAPEVPVIGHAYDYPIPNGQGIPFAFEGPWLQPSLNAFGYSPAEAIVVVHDAIDRFHDRLAQLAAVAANKFVLIETRGTMHPDGNEPLGWGNELHPYSEGFAALAEKFATALRRLSG